MPSDVPVVLISIDGLRPDGLQIAETPTLDALCARGASSLAVRTVMPSVTLPCHMSMFHSVPPGRHGITTNTWTPQVRPVPGLFDVAAAAGLRCASFCNWEQLRDLGRPGALEEAFFHRHCYAPEGDLLIAGRAAEALGDRPCDLTFVYLGYVDVAGHDSGWMSEPYLDAIANADAAVAKVLDAIGDRAAIVVTSDHGGHDQSHGTDIPEDMTVPLLSVTPFTTAGSNLESGLSILDVAPTVAALLGIEPARDWVGRPIPGAVPA